MKFFVAGSGPDPELNSERKRSHTARPDLGFPTTRRRIQALRIGDRAEHLAQAECSSPTTPTQLSTSSRRAT